MDSHSYTLDASIYSLRGNRSNFSFSFHISVKFMKANRISQDPDGTSRFAASRLGIFCLPMSHKTRQDKIYFESARHITLK